MVSEVPADLLVKIYMSERFHSNNPEYVHELVKKQGISSDSIEIVADNVFDRMSQTQTPQGIMAVVRMKDSSISDMLTDNPLLILVENLQDPGNLGTILRMGEGAGVVILEELSHAQARNANILAEVVGYGCTSDAYHITSPAEDGEGAARAMSDAVAEANIDKTELTYINAHGTSTHHNDLFETRAIKKAFGEHAYNIRINSTKSMVGHMLGAAGAVEFITCVKELEEGYIHPTVGFLEAEEEMDLNYVPDTEIRESFDYALSNSFGFGGHNASILIKKYAE